jgi:predicted ArsR family transcriptional regulator
MSNTASTIAPAQSVAPQGKRRGPKPQHPTDAVILSKLFRKGDKSVTALGTTRGHVRSLVESGQITVTGYSETGKRGRPARLYSLTDEARNAIEARRSSKTAA